jgi:hypothetical protein
MFIYNFKIFSRNNNSDKVAKFDEVIGDSRDINGNKPKINQGESHCRDINANKTKFVKESCDVIDMDLDTDNISSASPKTKVSLVMYRKY